MTSHCLPKFTSTVSKFMTFTDVHLHESRPADIQATSSQRVASSRQALDERRERCERRSANRSHGERDCKLGAVRPRAIYMQRGHR